MALTKNIRCLDAVALISTYLDGGLGWRERRRLEHHLAGCPACTAYLDQLRVTVASASTLTPEDVPSDVLDGLLDVFEKFRRDQD